MLVVTVGNDLSPHNLLASPPVNICKQTSAFLEWLYALKEQMVVVSVSLYYIIMTQYVILVAHSQHMQIIIYFLWCAANKLWSQPLKTATCGSLLGHVLV